VCCIDVESPEADGHNPDDPCSWSSIVAVLWRKLPDVPAERRDDFEDFIELVEGIAALKGR
jgi:hypothetical protein